jgi:hypothetical protein
MRLNKRLLRTESERLRLAGEAAQALNNPAVQEAFDAVEAYLCQQMLETSPEATESHSRLVLQLQLLAAVYRMLEGYLADGQVVQMSPEEISKLRID